MVDHHPTKNAISEKQSTSLVVYLAQTWSDKGSDVVFWPIFGASSQPSHLTEAKALRPQMHLNLPAVFSSYFATRSSG